MAEQNNTLHKGWLTTRDGAKFAPATLIENVFSRDGTSYDAKIKEYIRSEVSSVDGDLTEAVQTINNKVNTLDSKVDDSIQRLDNKDSEIENKLSNFGDDQGDRLYIVDKNDNVIAYVDQNGVTSTNFVVPGVTNFQAEHEVVESLQERMQTAEGDIDDIETALRNIDVNTDDDTFYIIDSQENVIAYINEDGVHSINFIIDNNNSDYANYLSLLTKVETHITEIQDLKTQDGNLQTQIQTLAESIDERLKNFNGEDDEIFFFIDSQDNVIAYIDADGIHTTGLSLSEAGLNVATTLNIHNQSGETIAFIDENGVHAVDFILENADIKNLSAILAKLEKADSDLNTALSQTNQALLDEIEQRKGSDKELQSDIDDINKRTEYVDATAADKFFIIDSGNNVIAYIDNTGIHSTEVVTEELKDDAIQIKYSLNTVGSDVDVLKSWHPEAQDEIDRNETDISRIFGMLGEDRNNDITPGLEHKTRLDTFDDILAIDLDAGEQPDGKSVRLDRLDNLVGVADENTTGTHEVRIQNLRTDLAAEQQRNNTHDTDIAALQKKTTNLDASGDDTIFFIVDNQNNVLAYFDSRGINVIDLYGHGITQDAQTGKYVVTNGRGQYSLNTKLKDILNDIIDLRGIDATTNNRLNNIEDRLANVSNVMDFIGAFATKNDLDKYATDGKAHNGDVAVVIENNTEYVYCIDDDPQLTGWVEMGYSTATQTAISNLQNVVGRTDALATGEASHEARLDAVEPIVNDHTTRLGQVEISLGMDDNGVSTRLQTIDELIGRKENDASANTHEGRIKFIEGRLSPVSNIMDFIGSFATKTALDAYTPCHHGDFAWVTGTNTEYIYDTNKWVEVGRSDQTVGEINGLRSDLANLQGVVGDTDIPSGALSHEQRIGTMEDKFEDLEVIFDWVKDDTLYIIDKNNNTLAYFDQNGLTVTDVHLLKSNGQTTSKATMMFFEETGTYSF